MTLIELTADDLCAMVSYPFPCEEGKIIDPIGAAHFLGLVETTAADVFDQAADEPKLGRELAPGDPTPPDARTADPRLVMLSLACSMEASQAVTQARALTADTGQSSAEWTSVKRSLDDFVDGLLASPPVLTTVFPPPGSVIVIGTIVITIPVTPPVPPRWEVGEQLARTQLLALATRFQAASKMSGVGATAEDLAGAAARLIDAAITR